MLVVVGVLALAIFMAAIVFGEARGWWMLCYAILSFAIFTSCAAYSIKREHDRLTLETQRTLAAGSTESTDQSRSAR